MDPAYFLRFFPRLLVVSSKPHHQGRTQGGFWVNPLEFDMLQKFVTCAKEVNRFRILFAC